MEGPKHSWDRWCFTPDALPWAPVVRRLATVSFVEKVVLGSLCSFPVVIDRDAFLQHHPERN